jgi:hypothetical protein
MNPEFDPRRLYFGKPRGVWVDDAVKALIASTTPSGRYLILRQGFLAFEQRAAPQFRAECGFSFTSHELRGIWEAIGRWVHRTERHLQRALERQYEQERRPH